MNPTNSRKNAPAQAAFTLIEIILVLSIIALLLGVGIANLDNIMGGGHEVRTKADIRTFGLAITGFQADTGRYLTQEEGLGALRRKPDRSRNWGGPCMERMPLDPRDGKYQYRFPGKADPTSPDIFSPAPDGIAETEDDICPDPGAGDDVY